MPFKSEAQRKFLHANHPKIAAEWEKHTSDTPLPAHLGTKTTTTTQPNPELVKALKRTQYRGNR